jgi:hypothetical protein
MRGRETQHTGCSAMRSRNVCQGLMAADSIAARGAAAAAVRTSAVGAAGRASTSGPNPRKCWNGRRHTGHSRSPCLRGT